MWNKRCCGGKSRVVFVKARTLWGNLSAKDPSIVGSSSKGSHRVLSRLHLFPACTVVGAHFLFILDCKVQTQPRHHREREKKTTFNLEQREHMHAKLVRSIMY
jgi:hypothetical protein